MLKIIINVYSTYEIKLICFTGEFLFSNISVKKLALKIQELSSNRCYNTL